MHRSWFFVFCFLFLSASGLGQSTATESQGMQALVAEVRQLRKDLETSNGNALKAKFCSIACSFRRQPLRVFRNTLTICVRGSPKYRDIYGMWRPRSEERRVGKEGRDGRARRT